MKVTSNQSIARNQRTAKKTAPERPKVAAAPKDNVSIAGVPQSELTPRVMRAMTQLMEEVSQLRMELAETKAKMMELSEMAFTDPLTGVYNRRAFVSELNRTLAVVERHGQPASLAFFDMDDMKSVNDGFGHAGGDVAINHVAKTIKENIRQTDIVGRLGGDEFAVIFNYSDQEAAAGKVRELRSQISEKN